MGITLFSFGGLMASLHGLMGWIAQGTRGGRLVSKACPAAVHAADTRTCSAWAALPGSCRDRPRRPVRVVRVMEACAAPSGAGRIVISGRMADVCAELDRLAALEAAAG